MKVFLLTVVFALAFLGAQTTDTLKKSTRKGKTPATRVAKKEAKADSLGAAARIGWRLRMIHELRDAQVLLGWGRRAGVVRHAHDTSRAVCELQGLPAGREQALIVAHNKQPLATPRRRGAGAEGLHIG